MFSKQNICVSWGKFNTLQVQEPLWFYLPKKFAFCVFETEFIYQAWNKGPFTGDPERYVKQGSEMGVCLRRGPAFGAHGGAFLS
jgi:hypothetical protein